MKKFFTIFLTIVVVLALIIVIFPKFTSKETCTDEEAIRKLAKGKFITVDGKRVHYVEKGDGTPVIMIHGFLYHTVMWEKNIKALAEKFKVYAIDLWGYGHSERLKKMDYSFPSYGKQVKGFMDLLNIKKATLVGQSMGGGISVLVAANYPEMVDRLILVDPAAIPYPDTMIGKIYKLPFVGEFFNAIPGDSLIKNNIKSIWFYD